MGLLSKIELEWKILGVAFVVLIAFLIPIQLRFEKEVSTLLTMSVDTTLEVYLRNELAHSDDSLTHGEVTQLLKNHLQWKALKPVILGEQRTYFIQFSLFLLVFLLTLSYLSFSRLIDPLKVLAKEVVRIGRGEQVEIHQGSGGALGTLECAIDTMQHELRSLRWQAEMNGMESAWRDIARVMAHEIKNPLTPMRLTMDRMDEKLLLGKEVTEKDIRRCVDRMNRQLDTLEHLVNRFRSFSNDKFVEVEPIAIHEVVAEIAGDVSNKIESEFIGEAMVMAEKTLLHQVLLNIYKNGINADATQMRVIIQKKEGDVSLSFIDNGCGVESTKLSQLFLPYITFTEGGSGIGLSVVKNLIELMGGSVAIFSEIGEGFEVAITLKGYKDGSEKSFNC